MKPLRMKRNSKTNDVYQHLLKYGKINSLEAIELYGATRLSAIIYNLRHKYDLYIKNEQVSFVDRNGRKSHYDNYVLLAIPFEADIDEEY